MMRSEPSRLIGFTEMPELIRQNRSFAPRGAAMPAGLPDLQAEVNRKSEVWAYNIEGYYEEAMTRQWNATTDIDWSTGYGPGVRGPAEALVMSMSGRKVALADLTGDGVDTLASRV